MLLKPETENLLDFVVWTIYKRTVVQEDRKDIVRKGKYGRTNKHINKLITDKEDDPTIWNFSLLT